MNVNDSVAQPNVVWMESRSERGVPRQYMRLIGFGRIP